MSATPLDSFRAIIPAGGAGTRLWPLSRRSAPKFLHDLTGAGRTLLQATYDRLAALSGPDGVTVVTGQAHQGDVAAQLPGLRPANLFIEPSPRDSMAAIGLAAAVLAEREGDVVVGSFAADHVIHDTATFHDAVRQAVEVAAAGYVATIGIPAASAATGFGYIHMGEALSIGGAPAARAVVDFTEKPNAETAAVYVQSGEYRWNAGMFVVRAQVLLGHLAMQRPALHEGLRHIAEAWDTPRRQEVLEELWPGLERVAIDHAIAEPVAASGGVAVIPGSFDWDDVGDWDSLASILAPRVADGARVVGSGEVTVLSSADTLVVAGGGRPVFVLGVDGAVVIDTPDALLVTTRERAQQVKQVVDLLRDSGREELL